MQDRLGRKGTWETLRRLALLPIRYGITTERLETRLRKMIDAMNRLDVTPTINVTAQNLESASAVADMMADVDVGIHGYRHIAYESLPIELQAHDLDCAIETFRKFDLKATGFRGPYLRTNSDTLSLLFSRHFLFDSSVPRLSWAAGNPLSPRILELAGVRYRNATREPCLPYRTAGLVEIPVSIPDDEILVDGLGLTNESTMGRVLSSMLDQAIETRSILVLQVHPERYDQFGEAVQRLLKRAIGAGAWTASLAEVAAWSVRQEGPVTSWPRSCPFAVAVTGDLDAVRLGDFGRRVRQAVR